MSNTTLKLCLVGSLMVNAFLVGAGLRHFDHPHGPPDPAQMLDHLTRDLSAPDAQILRSAFEQEHVDASQGPGDLEDFHRKIHDALLADPFDPRQLQMVFEQEGQRHAAFGAALGKAMADAAGQMSPEGRHHLADEKGPPR